VRCGESSRTKVTCTDEFELKKASQDLFEELDRIQGGTVVRLEFRHGLPFLLETTSTVCPATRP
jgi:hypothetical protein